MNDLILTDDLLSKSNSDLAPAPAEPAGSLAFVLPNDFPDLDGAEVGMRVERKYFEFSEAGQKVRAIFNGMDIMTSVKNGERKQIPAVIFQTAEGVFLNAGAGLVELFRTIPPGAPVLIEYLGTERTGSGNNVKKFDVHLLKVNVRTVRVENKPAVISAPEKEGYKHPELSTEYWTKAKLMRFTQEEGLEHLAANGNDFQEALAAFGVYD